MKAWTLSSWPKGGAEMGMDRSTFCRPNNAFSFFLKVGIGRMEEGKTWNMIDDYFMVILDPVLHVKYMSKMSMGLSQFLEMQVQKSVYSVFF